MTLEEVKHLANSTLRPVLGEQNIEQIVVKEREDWTGDPALYIDVFVDPELGTPDAERWLGARRSLSDQLVELGEMRFPFISLTDRDEQALAEAEQGTPDRPSPESCCGSPGSSLRLRAASRV